MENKKSQRNIPLSVLVVATIVLGFWGAASAFGFGFAPYWAIGGFDIVRSKSGHVMARAVILNDNGFPTYVEYDASGEEVREIAEASGFYADASLMSADRYRQIVENFRELKSEYEDTIALGAYVLTRDAYNATQFKTRNGEAVTRAPQLQESTLSVLVRHADQILIGDISPILFEAPVDLSEVEDVPENILSLLISNQGRVLAQAEGNIGFRSGYYKGDEDGVYWTKRLQDEDVYNGLANVEIEIPAGSVHGRAVTDESGYYKATYLLVPCPGFYFDYTIPIYAKMRYRMFNPRSASHNIFHMVATHYDACNGYGSSGSYSFFPANFLVDTAMLSGQGYMANPVEGSVNSVGQVVPMTTTGPTAYQYEAPQLERIAQTHFDFDGDEKPDRSVLGNLEDVDITDPETGAVTQERRFVPADEGELQGVYLSSGSNNPELPVTDASSQPDFVRLADRKQDFKHQGLVETINEEDYKDTDLYVFRESNGMLVTHRRGLRDNEFAIRSNDGVDGDQIFYQLLIRGPKTRTGTLSNDFSSFQSKADMNPALHAREADHLRPMEPIKIIAINRKTGYIGSVRTAFMDYSQPGLISVDIEKLVMRPPNLKVKAERIYDIEAGMTKGDEQEYLIGYEGAATTNDTIVTITTEWYDHDGTPLPEGLGEYGYTGRLAKVSGSNTLSTDGGQLAQFSVKPGRHLQTIRLKGDYDSSEHFYIQINGEPSNENPDFSTLGAAADGPLQYRPKHYVPFLVPLMNEDATIRQYNAYRALRRDDSIPSDQVIDPGPVHEWFYRPEMQFSMYDLQFQHIYRVADEEAGDAIDILPAETPTIASSDDLIRLAYDMVAQQFAALPYLGPGQELVFAFGEEEIGAVLDRNANVVFTNLEHFASLDPEDFLSIRLYNNNDPGNVLWEYAFEYLDIHAQVDVDEDRDENNIIMVSADDAEVELMADLVGYENRDEEDKYDATVFWTVTSPGSLEKSSEVNREYALFRNTLTTSRVAGSEYEVIAKLANGADSAAAAKLNFRVIPGVPSVINIETEGQAYVNKVGSVKVKATIKDAYGNLVDDNTSIRVATEGALEFLSPPGELKDGILQLELAGTDFVESTILTIIAGEVEKEVSIEVRPLTVVFQNFPVQADVNTVHNAQVQVTDDQGQPVSGAFVDVYSELGRVAESQVTTNNQGLANFTYISPQHAGTGSVKARVALQPLVEQPFTVEYPQGKKPMLDTYQALMVGNETTAGSFDYVRYDNVAISVPYQISGQLNLNGDSAATVSLSLGDIYEPNRLVQAALWMNTLELDGTVKDEVGFLSAVAENVSVVNGSPHIGGKSLHFSDGRITVADATRIKLASALSFSISIKPEQFQGTIINLADGIALRLNNDGTLTLRAITTNDSVEVHSEVISTDIWHRIAARYHNNQLTLYVDGIENHTALSGDIQYQPPVEGKELIIGQDFKGQMSGLKWYSLNSDALVTFADGSELLDVTLNQQGTSSVQLLSTGKMQSFASHLPMQSIAVSVAGERGTVNIVSSEFFGDLSRISIAGGLVENAPPIDEQAIVAGGAYSGWPAERVAQQLMSAVGSVVISPAYAVDISFWDVAKIIASLVGLDSIQVIWDQLGNMVAGKEVDIVAFSVAVLDVLSLFPPAISLKVVTGPAKLAIATLKLANPKAARYLGGVIKKLYDQAKNRDFSLVFQGIAFFIVAADMMLDEEAREGLKAMATTINSTEDFLGWIEYFSLSDPELLDETAMLMQYPAEQVAELPLQGLFPQAYAKVPAGAGKLYGKMLKELAPVLRSAGSQASSAVRRFAKVASENGATAKRIRQVAFRKNMLRGVLNVVKRAGLSKLRNWLLGYNGQRIPPLALFTVAAYLEEEIVAGRLFPDSQHAFDRERNHKQLNKLFVEAVPATFGGWSIAKAHGASYHLMQLAFMHASELNVLGIEVNREVPVFKSAKAANATNKEWSGAELFTRRVDIVTGTALHVDETWWEVKSWRSKSKTNRAPRQSIRTWTFLEGKTDNDGNIILAQFEDGDAEESGDPHKQLCLDRISKYNGARFPKSEQTAKGLNLNEDSPPPVKVENAYWNFHKFTAGKKKDIVNPQKNALEKALIKVPMADKNAFRPQSKSGTGMINLGATQQLMDILKENGFDLAEEALNDLPELVE